MESIFAKIKNTVQDDQLLSLITSQVGKLTSADQELGKLLENLPKGLSDVTGLLDELPLPDIDRSTILSRGFDTLKELIPTDTSTLTGDLTNTLEQFFGNLDLDLTTELKRFLDSFRALYDLTQPEFFSGKEKSEEPPSFPAAVGAMRANPNSNNDLDEALDNVREFLNLLPDPLTVFNLLGWVHDIIGHFPRQVYPLRYLPLLDELNDKLETTLAWREMDGNQLTAHLAGSMNKLAVSIQRTFISEGVQATADRLSIHANYVDEEFLRDSLDGLIGGLNILAQKARQGNLSGALTDVASLNTTLSLLQPALAAIKSNLLNGQITALNRELNTLDDKLNGRALQLLANLNPPSDLQILSLVSGPFNALIDEIGFAAINAKIAEFLQSLRDLLNQLNLNSVKDTFQDIIEGAVGAVEGLNQILINATVKFSLLIDRVEKAIDDLDIEKLLEEMEEALADFQKLVEEGINTVFEPLRNFLLTTFSTMNNFIAGFDPAAVIEEIMSLIRKLSNILSDPQLLHLVDSLHNTLDSINGELGEFSFKPVTDEVVDAIEMVRKILKTIVGLPMPESLKADFEEALSALPQSIEPATDEIIETLDDIINDENGPKMILTEIKEGPANLVELVQGYSPNQYLGENLSQPYRKFLERLAEYAPGTLLQPVQEALNQLKTQVQRVADPAQIFEPLQEPFDKLLKTIDEFDPNTIIQPLQEKLHAGITAIIENLPLDETNEIFDQVAAIADRINDGVDLGRSFRDLLQDFKSRLAGLADAESQVQDLANEIAAKFDQVNDIGPLLNALGEVDSTLDSIKAAPMQQYLDASLDGVIAKLTDLDSQNRLVSLVGAQRGFPRTALQALPDSPEKTAILEFLENFDPMAESYTIPLNALDEWRAELETAKTELAAFFSGWDNRYHGANSPFNELRRADLTLAELKTLLADTVQQQLTASLAPLFKVVDHLQSIIDTVLGELSALLDDLIAIVSDFLTIADSLEELRGALNTLVETLENFDISFIATEIESLFDSVVAKLALLNPRRIQEILTEALNNLLNILNINELLGAEALDEEHQRLLSILAELDPKKLVTDHIQPEYDKILVFLNRFDLSESIDTFLVRLTALREELSGELGRTADAYEDMVDVIPSEVRGSLGTAVSTAGGG